MTGSTKGGFGGFAEAMAMRDIIDELVLASLDRNRAAPIYAQVYTIDAVARTCMVVLNGDVTPIKVTCGSIVPSAVDQFVRLEGPPGARYVADVLGSSAAEQTATGNVPWQTPSIATGFAADSLNPPKWRVVEDHGSRKVQLRGALTSSSATTTLWTMPAGSRPVVNLIGILVGRNISGGAPAMQLAANSNGTLVVSGMTTGAKSGASGAWNGTTSITGPNIGHNHKFLNLEWGSTDGYRNADSGIKNFAQTEHSHSVPSHTHTVAAVDQATAVYLDGVEYFI